MIVDAWAQHPTRRFLESEMFASLRRWRPEAIPSEPIPIEATVAAMDAGAVDLARPMDALRELRRCVTELGFVGLRGLPWLWDAPPTDRRWYPLYAGCIEFGVPFCTQVGHTGPLRPSEPGRPIPYMIRSRSTSPS